MSQQLQIQFSGNATIIKSRTLFTPEDMEKVLTASPGKQKALKLTLTDQAGNEVVLIGRLRRSDSGNLTASVSAKLNHFEVVEIDAKEEQDAKSLLSQLGV